jgi:hypothetical protein
MGKVTEISRRDLEQKSSMQWQLTSMPPEGLYGMVHIQGHYFIFLLFI